jgi:hypothetical protein
MRLKAQNRVRLRLSPIWLYILHFQFNKSSVHTIITFFYQYFSTLKITGKIYSLLEQQQGRFEGDIHQHFLDTYFPCSYCAAVHHADLIMSLLWLD